MEEDCTIINSGIGHMLWVVIVSGFQFICLSFLIICFDKKTCTQVSTSTELTLDLHYLITRVSDSVPIPVPFQEY